MHGSPEIAALQQEFSGALWRAVWTMPDNLRWIITHVYLCDRSFEEVAQLVGESPDEIRGHHDKAVAHLKKRIEETASWQ